MSVFAGHSQGLRAWTLRRMFVGVSQLKEAHQPFQRYSSWRVVLWMAGYSDNFGCRGLSLHHWERIHPSAWVSSQSAGLARLDGSTYAAFRHPWSSRQMSEAWSCVQSSGKEARIALRSLQRICFLPHHRTYLAPSRLESWFSWRSRSQMASQSSISQLWRFPVVLLVLPRSSPCWRAHWLESLVLALVFRS